MMCNSFVFLSASPLINHHFPTLYHHKYELEDGRTESGGMVRYGFDRQAFPDYSWRGYAIFSRLQVNISSSSVLRLRHQLQDDPSC